MEPDIDPMVLRQVINALRDTITNPAKSKAEDFIKWVLTYVNEENLQNCIDDDLDIITLAFNHYGLGHSAVSPLLKTTLRFYWDEVEPILTDANKILEILSEKPECAKILNTPKGINYINQSCTQAYEKIFAFTWD